MASFVSRVARLAPVVLATLVAAGVIGCSPGSDSAGAPRPDVLLITIDTLRADFVHRYGFDEAITPQIDALADRGALFETAIAASTATAPAHASIMTSRYVRGHTVGALNGATRLEGATTLAERFAEAGYETAAFVSNVVLKARTGLDRGFDHYDDELPVSEANRVMYFERVARETVARARQWLSRERDAPFFAWVHLQDPHGPYTPGEPWSELAPELPLRTGRELPVLRANRGRGGIPHYQALPGLRRGSRYAGLYAGEVALADQQVGVLVAAAEEASARRAPGGKAARGLVIVLTADHGESLDEGGFFFQHGHATTPEQARVPLVVVAPGVAPGRLPGVVSHVDLAPTLLDLAGLPTLDAPSGISLLPAMRGTGSLPERSVLTDIGHELGVYDADGYWLVKVLPNGLDWQRFQAGEAGYAKAPGPPLPSEVHGYLVSAVEPVPAHAMDEQDVERLRALGYLPPAPE